MLVTYSCQLMKSIPEVSFSLTHIVGNARSLLLMFNSFVVLVKVDADFLLLEMLLEFLKSVSKVYFSSLHIKIYTIINLILVGFTRRVDQGLGWGEICVKYESNKCLSKNERYIVNVNMHSYL